MLLTCTYSWWFLNVSMSLDKTMKSLKQDESTIKTRKITDICVVSSDDCDQDEDYLHAFMLWLCREWSLSSQNHWGDLWNMTIPRHSWLLIGIVSSFKRAMRLHLQQWHTYNKQVCHTVWAENPKATFQGSDTHHRVTSLHLVSLRRNSCMN